MPRAKLALDDLTILTFFRTFARKQEGNSENTKRINHVSQPVTPLLSPTSNSSVKLIRFEAGRVPMHHPMTDTHASASVNYALSNKKRVVSFRRYPGSTRKY